jgi:hypothetical protein
MAPCVLEAEHSAEQAVDGVRTGRCAFISADVIML